MVVPLAGHDRTEGEENKSEVEEGKLVMRFLLERPHNSISETNRCCGDPG